jgi:NTP pyrophosphatase (non-canonical NTP hydrolase)
MLNKLAKEIHKNAVNHGWWDNERSFPEIIALCHSELSEALEEYRAGRPLVWAACIPTDIFAGCKHMTHCANEKSNLGCTDYGKHCQYKDVKPEGIAIELADCIIRILDYCAHAGIDIDKAILMKHEYNKTRPYRHGNKRI